MSKFVDLTGMKFGYLTVIERGKTHITPNGTKQTIWKCRCACGKNVDVGANTLKSGNTKSCGCLKLEMLLSRSTKHGCRKEKHTDRLYQIWRGMTARCRNDFRYAGRGITVCDDWKDYTTFKVWAYANGYDENAPFGECTIDRIDNNGNYEPSNCRWVNNYKQQQNTRRNRLIEYKGEVKCVSVWAREIGISPDAFYNRLNTGWTIDEIMTIPKINANRKYAKY